MDDPDNLSPVTVSIPVAIEYEPHPLRRVGRPQQPRRTVRRPCRSRHRFRAELLDGSGVTERQGIGSATFNGDWVAAVRRQYASDAEAGAINMYSGPATLTANFEDGRVHGCSGGPRHAGRHAFRQRVLGHEGDGHHARRPGCFRHLRGRVQRRHLRADRLGGRWRLRLRRRRSRRVRRCLRRQRTSS